MFNVFYIVTLYPKNLVKRTKKIDTKRKDNISRSNIRREGGGEEIAVRKERVSTETRKDIEIGEG